MLVLVQVRGAGGGASAGASLLRWLLCCCDLRFVLVLALLLLLSHSPPLRYLNAGPGGIAGMFVHERHANKSVEELPRLSGWWGHQRKTRFDMGPEFVPQPGARGFQLSNPPTLPMIALRESLNLHDEATMPRLRAKSLLLTEYLRALVVELCGDKVDIITPTEAHRHGAQLSLVIKSRELSEVHAALRARGIVCDERKPNVIRIAPAPIYNSFQGACRPPRRRRFSAPRSSRPPQLTGPRRRAQVLLGAGGSSRIELELVPRARGAGAPPPGGWCTRVHQGRR